jgi:hypothetical protein
MFFYSEPATVQVPENNTPEVPNGAIMIEEGLYLVSEENGLYIVLE